MKKVTWTMPEPVSDLLHETLVMDSKSAAFAPELRRAVRDALKRVEIKEQKPIPKGHVFAPGTGACIKCGAIDEDELLAPTKCVSPTKRNKK